MKTIAPYLQRAQELRQREPVIAYYCKFYATKQGLLIKDRSPEDTTQLMKLLDELELEKAAINQNANYQPTMASDDASYAYLSQFALKIFYQADSMDRQQTGQVPKKQIALTFLAAKIFLDVLGVFGVNDDPSISEKIKYAKWRAAEISKAIKENRPAVPPPDDDLPAEDEQPEPKIVQAQVNNQIVPVVKKQDLPPAYVQPRSNTPSAIVDTTIADQATKHCRFTISALQYDDIPTAIKNLEQALVLLRKL